MLEITYDGEYPNTCGGSLTIKINGDIAYKRAYCCISTGSCEIDSDGYELLEIGKLLWTDNVGFTDDIIQEVNKYLEQYEVCCGGCI